MKKLALVFIFLLTLNTTFCMHNGIPRDQKVLLPIFTDVIEDDNDPCCELAVDYATSCGGGASAACVAHHIFGNPLATLLAFTIGTFTVFGIRTGEPFKANDPFDQKEKTD